MLYSLNDLKVYNPTVLKNLRAYLDKISHYPNFDYKMRLRVYATSELDFTCFESVEYQLGFTAMNHKLIDTIKSKYQPLIIDFKSFHDYILKL